MLGKPAADCEKPRAEDPARIPAGGETLERMGGQHARSRAAGDHSLAAQLAEGSHEIRLRIREAQHELVLAATPPIAFVQDGGRITQGDVRADLWAGQ